MKKLSILLAAMMLFACKPIEVTVNLDTPRDTIINNAPVKSIQHPRKGKADLYAFLGIVCDTTMAGISSCKYDKSKWVTISDTTYTYLCEYKQGWKCKKIGTPNDPLGIR